MKWSIKKSTDSDIVRVALKLREADRLELKACNGHSNHFDSLRISVKASHQPFTIFNGDEPVGMFGVCPGKECGIPWLLGTDKLTDNKKFFISNSRRITQEWFKRYPVLINYIDCRNQVAIQWLEYLGFTMGARYLFADPDVPFYQFKFSEV